MSITLAQVLALEALEAKLRAILPEQYRDSYDEVVPVSMGSAGLKYGADGRVAWDEMWASFCDLAMAGGPPHRGTLLQPAELKAIKANPNAHHRVVEEIERGISLTTNLPVLPAPSILDWDTAWVRVQCRSAGMAGWLVRAIVMENVLAKHDKEILYLPAGPEFLIGKEIKNVITVLAKTCHYWSDHMSPDQQKAIDTMICIGAKETELLDPVSADSVADDPEGYQQVVEDIALQISERTGRVCFSNRYTGWIGVDCPDVRTAIWLMRAMIVENVLARREETVLFLPANTRFAKEGLLTRLVQSFEGVHRLHAARKFE